MGDQSQPPGWHHLRDLVHLRSRRQAAVAGGDGRRRQPAAPNVFSGDLLTFSGSRFDAFDPTKVASAPAGSGTFTFSDLDHAKFDYTVAGVPQTKQIKRRAADASPMATCAWGAQSNLALAANYQDLWYAFPADSEKGWGVNLTHQGNTIFATWFTYGVDGQPLWLVAAISNTAARRTSITGALFKVVSGPPFNAVPFDFAGDQVPGGRHADGDLPGWQLRHLRLHRRRGCADQTDHAGRVRAARYDVPVAQGVVSARRPR